MSDEHYYADSFLVPAKRKLDEALKLISYAESVHALSLGSLTHNVLAAQRECSRVIQKFQADPDPSVDPRRRG